MNPGSDPVPREVRVELERLAGRWAQLPLDQALRHVPAVHAYAVELAGAHAAASSGRISGEADTASDAAAVDDPAPALGTPRPELVIDRLTAVLFDVFDGFAPAPAPEHVTDRLVALRRELN